MKSKLRIIMYVIIAIAILLTNFFMLINSVQAANLREIKQIELHSRGTCEQLLKYKGVIVKTTFVEYTYDGKSYPAYCLDKTLPGITDELVYSVETSKLINDVGLWRIIINGYPYKTLSELGVANEEEAFTATKQAIYCYLFENTPDDYEPIGEAGQRTLNALNMIVSNGNNSKEIQNFDKIEIKHNNKDWIQDEKDEQYVYKTYSLNSNINNLDYEISQIDNLPEDSKIINLKGEETLKFSKEESFKIMLKKENIDKDGNFKINIKTKVKTKPVIYGASPNSSWQNYALTGYMYEDSIAVLEDNYKKIEKPSIPEKDEEKTRKTQIENVKILPVTGM